MRHRSPLAKSWASQEPSPAPVVQGRLRRLKKISLRPTTGVGGYLRNPTLRSFSNPRFSKGQTTKRNVSNAKIPS